MTDLLLVNPLFLHEDPVEHRLMTPYFPLGLLYLAATARNEGYDVAIFDGMFQSGDEAFIAALEREQPKVVGIGVLVTVRAAALRLAALAHQYGAKVIVGGADPTGRPESYLKHPDNRRQPEATRAAQSVLLPAPGRPDSSNARSSLAITAAWRTRYLCTEE